MAEPIKNKRLNDIAGAPTPQNTPATAASSYIQRAADAKPSVSTIAEEGDATAALGGNLSLINMIQGRLNGLVGSPTGYIDGLPKPVKDRINGLRAIQGEHSELSTKFQEELLELEKKYFKLYTPLYEKRAKIVSGDVEPTAQEIEEGQELAKKAQEMWEGDDEKPRLEEISEEDDEDEKDEEDEEADKDIKGIPEFWLTALKNIPEISEIITEKDAEALSFVTDIRMKYLDKPGFALEFEFAENPFFTNKIVNKSYYYKEEPGYGGDYIYDRAIGDEINWTSPEQNLTVKIEKRKQRNKHTKATRIIEKSIPIESFFHFFNPPIPPVDEEEVDDAIENKLELDYHVGEVIKEKLIPNAIDWFTGEALRYEDYDEEDFGDEDYDDEDDEDDDDEDDDEDEEGNAKKSEECKQS